MNAREFAQCILMNLPYVPNDQQVQLIAALARFCIPESNDEAIFLLNGYAGTGKTSLTGSLVKALSHAGISSVLLAPTGRAAKVFARFAKHPAYTIHRRIYRTPSSGSMALALSTVADNRSRDTIFIVDEASMIGSNGGDLSGSLLEDLIQYVYSGQNCRLLLLGDTAQLPPVGYTFSPAMDVKTLRGFNMRVVRAVLTETVRQAAHSGILYNATWLRKAMKADPLPTPILFTSRFDDVKAISGEFLAEALETDYATDGTDETILITRSNKRAVQFNRAIRANILYKEEELTCDELLLIAKNNYLWSSKIKGIDFIANGDVATVTKVYESEYKYGFRFVDVRLRLPDRDVEFDCKVMLDTLHSEAPGLDPHRQAYLHQECLNDPDNFAPDTPMPTRLKALKTNPYYNALQVKYAYAVTCHKAQGGQWRNVYIDMGYIPPEAQGLDFYRWLYTATTRATHRLTFLNPDIEQR